MPMGHCDFPHADELFSCLFTASVAVVLCSLASSSLDALPFS